MAWIIDRGRKWLIKVLILKSVTPPELDFDILFVIENNPSKIEYENIEKEIPCSINITLRSSIMA